MVLARMGKNVMLQITHNIKLSLAEAAYLLRRSIGEIAWLIRDRQIERNLMANPKYVYFGSVIEYAESKL